MGLRYFADIDEESKNSAIEALVEYLDNDVSYYVRAHSAHSLGFYKKSEKAFDALKKALEQESVNDQIRYRAFLGFAEMKDTRAIALAKEYLEKGKNFQQGKPAATIAIGKVGKAVDEAPRILFSLKKDPDDKVRSEAASALASLGDASAIPELENWLESESVGRVRRRIREAIFILKKAQTMQVNDRIEGIEAKLKTMTEKIEKL